MREPCPVVGKLAGILIPLESCDLRFLLWTHGRISNRCVGHIPVHILQPVLVHEMLVNSASWAKISHRQPLIAQFAFHNDLTYINLCLSIVLTFNHPPTKKSILSSGIGYVFI